MRCHTTSNSVTLVLRSTTTSSAGTLLGDMTAMPSPYFQLHLTAAGPPKTALDLFFQERAQAFLVR